MRKFSLSDRENEDALLELLVSSEEVQSVTKRILDHRKKLIDEYISEVIKPVDKYEINKMLHWKTKEEIGEGYKYNQD